MPTLFPKGTLQNMRSMTAFGRATVAGEGYELTVELRSVNNRYLDCSVKAPRMLSFGEEAVKQAVVANESVQIVSVKSFIEAGVRFVWPIRVNVGLALAGPVGNLGDAAVRLDVGIAHLLKSCIGICYASIRETIAIERIQ